jgi:hypothetical protein
VFHTGVVGVETLAHWWNKRWGRIARRDIWLRRETIWRVEARQGDGDARVWSRVYPTEREARLAVRAMMDRTGGPDQWRDMVPLTDTRPPVPEPAGDQSSSRNSMSTVSDDPPPS